jgi:hypothetical protein
MGLMREHEQFGQARSGTFGGEFNYQNDGNDPLNTGYAYANAFLGHVTSYTESMGRVPDDRWQNTWAWYAQDTWKPNAHLTLDLGLRMYKWDLPFAKLGESSAFSFERFDPKWGGNPPVLFRPITTSAGRRAVNPLTGEVLPVTFVGLMVPGTGFTCTVITPSTPCKINGVVVQEDSTFASRGKGFVIRCRCSTTRAWGWRMPSTRRPSCASRPARFTTRPAARTSSRALGIPRSDSTG